MARPQSSVLSPHHCAAAALFLALAVAMTWPLAPNLGSAVAWPGDPFINIWILDWDWWATLHQPLALFQANAFYPAKDALAYSENLYGIALFLFPFRAAGVPPIAAYNLAMLLGYAFSGFGAYLLGWYVTRSWWAGVAAGIFYAFVPFRITHAAHVQHVWAGWLPILIVALLHYAKQPSWPRAALFGAAFLFNGLSNIHWLLFGTVAIAMTALCVIPSAARNPLAMSAGDSSPSARLGMTRATLPLAACTLTAALLLAPFLIPYATVAREYKMLRGWQEVKSFSAEPRDWLVAASTSRWYGSLKDATVDPERWLFPGVVAIVLCAAAAWWRPSPGAARHPLPASGARELRHQRPLPASGARELRHQRPLPAVRGEGGPERSEGPGEGRHPPILAIALAWLLLGVAGSLGTHFFLHRFLFRHVPGFQAIRVPARWANIAYVGMAMLIALGVGAIARNRRWIAGLAAIALVVDLCAVPLLWYIAVPENPAVYAQLTKAHAILELPIGAPFDYAYLLRATAHHRPIVNGTSGFTPPETRRIEAMVNSDALLPELRRVGVDTVVVHGDYVSEETRRWLGRENGRGRLGFVRRFDNGIYGDWLFCLECGGRAAALPSEFLAGKPTPNAGTFGFLDLPLPDQRIDRAAYFSGFALSPYGIRSVTLLLQNGRVRLTPTRFDDAALQRRFPWYPATTKPRFIVAVDERPRGVAEQTDVQVEIVDGRGKRLLLEDRFFIWPDRR